MRALCLTLLDRIMYLAQLGLITREERVEYANLVRQSIGNDPGDAISTLHEKLKAKAFESTQCDELYETLHLLENTAVIN